MAITYTIRTRGLIPGILKRGPMSHVKLDHTTLKALVEIGVDIINDSTGKQVTMDDLFETEGKSVIMTGKAPTGHVVVVPESLFVSMPIPRELENAVKDSTSSIQFPSEDSEPKGDPAPTFPVPPGMKEMPGFAGEFELDPNGEPLINGEEDPASQPAEATAPTKEPEAPTGKPENPYAGMSKNQRKKAQAKAAADAAKGTQK